MNNQTNGDIATDGRTKAEIKADRKAKQAQRAAKAAKATAKQQQPPTEEKNQQQQQKQSKAAKVKVNQQQQQKSPVKSASQASAKGDSVVPNESTQKIAELSLEEKPTSSSVSHPALVELKQKIDVSKVLDNDTFDCELLTTLSAVVRDYEKPVDKSYARDFEQQLDEFIAVLESSRSLSYGAQNIVKLFRQEIVSLPVDVSAEKGCKILTDWLEDFQQQKIELAFEAISMNCRNKLANCTVVGIYSWSRLIVKILVDAFKKSSHFRVIVIDSLPDQRGKIALKQLLDEGIQCSYGLITSIGYLLRQCHVVLLGADGVLSNGAAASVVGSEAIAVAAAAFNIPLLVAAPTYKFVDKAQTGGDHDTRRQSRTETVASELIGGLATELRLLPASSAPAVLRVVVAAT